MSELLEVSLVLSILGVAAEGWELDAVGVCCLKRGASSTNKTDELMFVLKVTTNLSVH